MDDLDFPGWEPAKSVQVVEGNGLTQVLVKGQPYMRWQSGDEGCTRLAIVQLYKCGLGTEEDLAAAFGRHINSVQNYLRDFTGEGIQGLMTERRGPKGPVEAHPGVAREDLADRFAGRYLETGSDSTALAGSLAGGGERSEHPTSVGGKRAGRTDPPGASAARGSKLSFLPASRSRSWFCPWRVVPPNSGSQ